MEKWMMIEAWKLLQFYHQSTPYSSYGVDDQIYISAYLLVLPGFLQMEERNHMLLEILIKFSSYY
jgi:hypothetical protein